MIEKENKEYWDGELKARSGIIHLNIKEIISHWYLCTLFVKRDLIATYKQTVLGPLWFLIQPILTTITFTIIFGNVAKLSTDGMPQILFYLSGITIWGYFAESLTKTSHTFVANQALFGKVYFPRLIVPLAIIFTNLIKFSIQLALFLSIWVYYLITQPETVVPSYYMLFLPVFVITMAMLGLGFGILISAMTTKYRDMANLVGFGVQLMMYASPIIYPLSTVSGTLETIIRANPMTSVIHNFKVAFLGAGQFDFYGMLYSLVFGFVILFLGLVVFTRVERSFIDTV
jgi:lipopolysaccharide transport system permease protein